MINKIPATMFLEGQFKSLFGEFFGAILWIIVVGVIVGMLIATAIAYYNSCFLVKFLPVACSCY